MHANSLANLKKGVKFGEGQPINVNGAPKGKRLSTWLKELGEQEISYIDVDGLSKQMPVKKAVAVSLVAKALSGDVQALKLVGSYYLSHEEPEQTVQTLDIGARRMLESAGIDIETFMQN